VDWTPFHNALECWAKEAAGVDVIWVGQAIEETYAPLVELQILSVSNDGEDIVRRTDPDPDDPDSAADLVESTCGTRKVMVQFRARSRDYDPATYALAIAEQAKSSLNSTNVIESLHEQGLAFISASDVRVLPTGYRGRIEQEAVFDLAVSVSVHEQLGTVGWFNRVRVTSNLRSVTDDALSDSLQLDAEEIGPPP
jgi:hypothetical protein